MTWRRNSEKRAGNGELCVSPTRENRDRGQRAWTETLGPAGSVLLCPRKQLTPGSPTAITTQPPWSGQTSLILRDGLLPQRTKAGVSKQVCTGTFWLYWGIEIQEEMNLTREKVPLLVQTSKVFIRKIYHLNTSKHNWIPAQEQHENQVQT